MYVVDSVGKDITHVEEMNVVNTISLQQMVDSSYGCLHASGMSRVDWLCLD